uniref:Uncharacterized protein n=1 Tax=Noctiluca scintillans TaxID=2966 RepID=A0A7S1FDN8_NOCSC
MQALELVGRLRQHDPASAVLLLIAAVVVIFFFRSCYLVRCRLTVAALPCYSNRKHGRKLAEEILPEVPPQTATELRRPGNQPAQLPLKSTPKRSSTRASCPAFDVRSPRCEVTKRSPEVPACKVDTLGGASHSEIFAQAGRLRGENTSLREEIHKLRGELAQAAAMRSEARSELQKENQRLKAELDKATTSLRAEVRKENGLLQHEIHRLKVQKGQAIATIHAEAVSERRPLYEENQKLKAEIAQTRSSFRAEALAANAALRKENQWLKTELERGGETFKERLPRQRESREVKPSTEETIRNNAMLRNENEELKQELTRSGTSLREEARLNNSRLLAENEKLKRELAEARTKSWDAVMVENSTLRKENAHLKETCINSTVHEKILSEHAVLLDENLQLRAKPLLQQENDELKCRRDQEKFSGCCFDNVLSEISQLHGDAEQIEAVIAEVAHNCRCNRTQSEHPLLRKEKRRLRGDVKKANILSCDETLFKYPCLKQDNGKLTCDLTHTVSRECDCDGIAEISQLRCENEQLRSELLECVPSGPEARLRAALTNGTTTTHELRSAIQCSASLLEEAKRELASKEHRDRRAAHEHLYAAIALDQAVELEAAIEQARLVNVELEDVVKGEEKLAELRALSDDQLAEKHFRKDQARLKKEAFHLVKKDDVPSLKTLIEGLDDRVQWRDWKDYAGRSLWKCAHDLHATTVQEFLAPVLGKSPPSVREDFARIATPEGPERRPDASKAACERRSVTFSEEAIEVEVQKEMDWKLQENEGQGDTAWYTLPSEDDGVQIVVDHVRQAPVSEACCDVQKEVLQETLDELATTPARSDLSCTISWTSRKTTADNLWNVDSGWSSPRPRSDQSSPCVLTPTSADESELRTKALRAAARDDSKALTEVLAAVDVDVWSKWKNRAGQDLLSLSEARQSSDAYSLLASALGLLHELPRETFIASETVWVFVADEVMPKRATVLDDIATAEDAIQVEFWDGDVPSQKVERCRVRKMTVH